MIHPTWHTAAGIVAVTGTMIIAFHGLRADGVTHRWPIVAVIITGLTLATNGLQIAYPPLVELCRRNPVALFQHGEFWRILTPLFVQSGGWRQILSNTLWAFLLSPIAAQRFGTRMFLMLYFGGGLVGELAGYAWSPDGAGSSVALGGLAGGLAVHLMKFEPLVPGLVRGAGTAVLPAAIVLAVCHDLHGPSLLFGAIAAFAWQPSFRR